MDRNKILSVDLEITRDGKRLLRLGAIAGDQQLDIKGHHPQSFIKLNQLAQHAHYLLGHNIISHDLPWLLKHNPDCTHLRCLPIIDTLFLSPLAFPKNPYHRLVKDYKIVKDSYNDPVADARLALSVFDDQLAAFEAQYRANGQLIELYYYLFSRADTGSELQGFHTSGLNTKGLNTRGLQQVMAWVMGKPNDLTIDASYADTLIQSNTAGRACPTQLRQVMDQLQANQFNALCLAYAVAWLQVAGGNSVLPPWVWHRFPQVKLILQQLRDQHCGSASCSYCQDNFNSKKYLRLYFEMADFRSLPDGKPLQRDIVDAGINGKSLLAILPTGGGKSLCYQLPALIKNQRNAALTIIISPLQALMKDQVDNLKDKAGVEGVAAIYGLITMPERSALLEEVKMGDIATLYLSPEQLRNRSVKRGIAARQIGAWVFDEANAPSAIVTIC